MAHLGTCFVAIDVLVWPTCVCPPEPHSISFGHIKSCDTLACWMQSCSCRLLQSYACCCSWKSSSWLPSSDDTSDSRLLCLGRSTGGKGSAFALAETLGAVTAVQQVCREGDPLVMVGGRAGPSAPGSTAPELLQVLCEQSISAAGRKAVGVAIAAVPGALQRIMTLMQVSISTGTHACIFDASKVCLPKQVRAQSKSYQCMPKAWPSAGLGRSNNEAECGAHTSSTCCTHTHQCTVRHYASASVPKRNTWEMVLV